MRLKRPIFPICVIELSHDILLSHIYLIRVSCGTPLSQGCPTGQLPHAPGTAVIAKIINYFNDGIRGQRGTALSKTWQK
jgi:hypothetical protein